MSMKPDSVLLVTPRWTRDGGVAAHVKASAAVLARHGLRVQVLAARIESNEHVPGVVLHHRPELFNAGASMDARLGEALSSRPAVIHIHQVDDPEIVDAMRMSAPVVISAHGYTACTSGVYYFRAGHECTRSHGLGCVVNLAARGCAHTFHPKPLPSKYRSATRGLQALMHADLVVAYSSSVNRHLAANGVTRRTVVPLFTTMVPKPGSGHATRRRVVFAGRIAAPKGVGILIRAAREVNAEFVICGDGWRSDAMRRLARRLGIEERICFKGWLDPVELAEELANASVVVMPSLWPEPFGLVGIEALSAGRPVIASSTGGIGDWLHDGVTGLCVRPGDARALARALNELLADPDRQRTMGAAGREMVAARFSPERHVQALLESYQTARSTWQAGQREQRTTSEASHGALEYGARS
jgi:glycosyltransferase involved in cell wall biosynthesis